MEDRKAARAATNRDALDALDGDRAIRLIGEIVGALDTGRADWTLADVLNVGEILSDAGFDFKVDESEDPPVPRTPLDDLPTLAVGQDADLKIDASPIRVWVSRLTVEDGAPFDRAIEIERYNGERWTPVATLGR